MNIGFDLDYIKKVVEENKLVFWPDLYQKLGIEGLLLSRQRYDVKYIIATSETIYAIKDMFIENSKKSKDKRIRMYKQKYKETCIAFDTLNYAPTIKENVKGIEVILDENA